MSVNAAERRVVDYLVDKNGLDRVAAANLLHRGIADHWFMNAEPELKALNLSLTRTHAAEMAGARRR